MIAFFLHLGFRASALTIIILIFASSLLGWTLLSPHYMSVQDSSEISSSVFQYANDIREVNFTDAGGSYSFLFALDYNKNLTLGQPAVVAVYISLVSEKISSLFEKGVSLKIDGAAALIDGDVAEGSGDRSTFAPNILSVFLTSVKANSPGAHSLSARLIVSTVDVNYVGYFSGSEQVVDLNGTIGVVE
ncbi:MAG: hypothetical protein ACRDF4_02530 [Rhabdochlamydiaceae bacterium]